MEIAADFPGLIRLHKDGTVHRHFSPPYAPPSPTLPDPDTSVLSKDLTLAGAVSGRLYLPPSSSPSLPLILYFHGGGFCVESPFSALSHRYLNHLCSATSALILSIRYRLAPEHPLPAAYSDAWSALRSTPSLSDPWLSRADFDSFFLAGDSAGANIVHHLAIRSSDEPLPAGIAISGVLLCHSYFIDSSRRADHGPIIPGKWTTSLSHRIWEMVYPGVAGGPSSPMIDPMGPGAPCLSKLGCKRVLVVVGEEDELRDVNVKYCEAVRRSGYGGEVELVVVGGEGHAFQVFDPASEKARGLLRQLGRFVAKK